MLQTSWRSAENGHLDVSFRETDTWPRRIGPIPSLDLEPSESIIFFIGDPTSGPAINLLTSGPSERQFGFGPTHAHRNDTFRMSLRGDLLVTPRHFAPGEFLFLEAGRFYSTGYGPSPEGAWQLVMHGDRRGASTMRTGKKGSDTQEIMEEMRKAQLSPEVPTVEGLCAAFPDQVPNDSIGTTEIATTLGEPKAGRLVASFEEQCSSSWKVLGNGTRVAVGLLGDHLTGPVVAFIKALPGEEVLSRCAYATEVVVTVVSGSCEIAGSSYSPGDIRIQEAGVPFDALQIGSEGFEAVMIWGDRRSLGSNVEPDAFASYVAKEANSLSESSR